jgi:hypothetical protein
VINLISTCKLHYSSKTGGSEGSDWCLLSHRRDKRVLCCPDTFTQVAKYGERDCVLECDAVYSGRYVLTSQRILPPSSGQPLVECRIL